MAPNDARIALVADDDPGVLSLISRVLVRQGWSVLEAADATSALRQADGIPLDLLVTDYEMTALTGLGLARLLRGRQRDLRVLVVSGRAQLPEALPAGRTAFVHKPFAIDELLDGVGSVTEPAA